MPILNLGVVAHVDAGKTTLTERLLLEAGVITAAGRVDHGDTVTDADAVERRRGITIRSAVVAFDVGDVSVHLIDTPGHSDFVAEVERALAVLDGAVLVVSAVEGVQAQTRVLVSILQRQRIPFAVFVNKLDRVGSSYSRALGQLREALAGEAMEMSVPHDEGTRGAGVLPTADAEFRARVTEVAADEDEQVLRRFVETGAALDSAAARASLRRLAGAGLAHPVYAGVALAGTGVRELINGVAALLPCPAAGTADPLHAQVFKVERGDRGERVAYARVWAGELAARDQVEVFRPGPAGPLRSDGKPTTVARLVHGADFAQGVASAGDIALLGGLDDVRIGDQLGNWHPKTSGGSFARPGLEAAVRVAHVAQRSALFAALTELSAQDPLVDARLDGGTGEIRVSLYGEVQKEVLAERLASDFGIQAEFSGTTVAHVERVVGRGEDTERIGSALAGLRIESGPIDSGFEYRLAVERGWLLPSYHTAIEETLAAELGAGLLGWPVVDCVVTLIASRFGAPTPPAGYFRDITRIALRKSLEQAGTEVCEPFSEFEADIPTSSLTAVLQRIIAARGVPDTPTAGQTRARVTGVIPTAEAHGVEARLPDLTSGLGAWTVRPAGFRPVVGRPPVRVSAGS